MDEETAIIDANTRNEKIKNFFIKNKTKIISLVVFVIIILVIFFSYKEFQNRDKVNISDKFNSLTIDYKIQKKNEVLTGLELIINEKNPTYSPLALYFIIDNKLTSDVKRINSLFDILIEKTPLEKEIKNLVIYKKALFNADLSNENELLSILKPIINSDSVWKSQALYLLGEFFISQNEKQKAKDFFEQIISLPSSNEKIRIEAKKRLDRDLSD
jgi:predicted negative regulator of RcsB-dependent stress response